jgi:phospho-N-acetylmuramoyl-pentapeptide-transferase
MKSIIILFLISFVIAVVISPLVLILLRRLKAGQSILHYVDFHAKKSGTPTMGGFIFILPLVILAAYLLWGFNNPRSLIIIIASLSFGAVGFLDDFLKVKRAKNLGLRAYQKIIAQGGIALLVSWFYFTTNPTGALFIPFFNITIMLGWFIIPLCFVAIIATVNSVNLTDGLDGLAGSVSKVYLIFITAIILIISARTPIAEAHAFAQIAAITCGGLLCYLIINTNKAAVFMGDTGSLYLGSIIALVSIFSGMMLYLLIIGVMFVMSSVSDILQVAYFKKTGGKRIFLMAPFHHHLEKKGYNEAKIVFIYVAVTVLMGAVCLVSVL